FLMHLVTQARGEVQVTAGGSASISLPPCCSSPGQGQQGNTCRAAVLLCRLVAPATPAPDLRGWKKFINTRSGPGDAAAGPLPWANTRNSFEALPPLQWPACSPASIRTTSPASTRPSSRTSRSAEWRVVQHPAGRAAQRRLELAEQGGGGGMVAGAGPAEEVAGLAAVPGRGTCEVWEFQSRFFSTAR